MQTFSQPPLFSWHLLSSTQMATVLVPSCIQLEMTTKLRTVSSLLILLVAFLRGQRSSPQKPPYGPTSFEDPWSPHQVCNKLLRCHATRPSSTLGVNFSITHVPIVPHECYWIHFASNITRASSIRSAEEAQRTSLKPSLHAHLKPPLGSRTLDHTSQCHPHIRQCPRRTFRRPRILVRHITSHRTAPH